MTRMPVRREVGEFKPRFKWFALVATAVFLLLIGRMFQLQILQHDHWAAVATDNITRTVRLPATRGTIEDTAGRVVADSRPSYSVYVTPRFFDTERELPRLARLLDLDAEQTEAIARRLRRVPPRRRGHSIRVLRDIRRDQLAALETHERQLRGVDVVDEPVRHYPYRSLGAHAIGYVNEITAEELRRLRSRGYHPRDRIGRTGIERAWENVLRGQDGYVRFVVDVRGRRQNDVALPGRRTAVERVDPVAGHRLRLTLDMELMQALRRAFRGHPAGAAVVVEMDTGRVRALFSKPSFDPEAMARGMRPEAYAKLRDNPFRPLIDRTVYESYFPGSTFKPISALAGLAEGKIDPAARVECTGALELGKRRFRCTQAHGEVDLREALVRSCNVYFYRLGMEVGIDALARYARMLGLGERTGIGINSESAGFIATREWYVEHWGSPYRLGFTLNAAIGQGNTRVTLLQLAMAYAALFNGGHLFVPQLVEEVRAPDGRLLEHFSPQVRREVDVDPHHAALLLEALRGVVEDPEGTAHGARIEGGVPVAGKTGTAQVPHAKPPPGEDPRRAWYWRRDHAWFVGLAPADAPRYVIVVIVEHGGAGGRTAAPIGIRVLDEYLGGRVHALHPASQPGAGGPR